MGTTDRVQPRLAQAEYPEDDMRSWDDRWQGDNYTRNKAAVAELARLAETRGIRVTQLALAWLLARGDDVVPIRGTRSEARLAENVGAADVELTDADLALVREILPEGSYGSRYPAEMMPVGFDDGAASPAGDRTVCGGGSRG